jgi:hypothetical protein
MGPRLLQSQIHSNYSIESGVWTSYKTGIESMYQAASSKADFNNHLIREYNRKIDTLNQPPVLFMSPYDAGFRYAPYSETISAILGGDNAANALEPNATAHLLIDGPLYNTLGDPDSGFVGGQSWRSLAPNGTINNKSSYLYGDEVVKWDGTQWLYFNIYDSNWEQLGSSIDGEASGDLSGYSVSINAVGDRMVVGAPTNDGTSGTDRGSVRVYELTNGSWIQLGGDIDGEASGDWSGYSVSINDVGNRVIIGAYLNDNTSGTNSGHVRVYELIDDVWTQLGVDINGEGSGDFSGWSVSMNADGNRIAVGAILNNSTLNFTDNGHVRIYEWNGSSWNQLGLDINGVNSSEASIVWAGANSGWSISMNADGDRVAIGAVYNDGINGFNSGNVRIFQWDGSSWTQLGQEIDGEAADDNSGFSVSINAAGNRVAIGTPFNDGAGGYDNGHVRIFQFNGSSWDQMGSDIDGRAESDYSGWSVSLNANGNRVAIGATIYNEGGDRPGGYVRVYEFIDGDWQKLDIDIEAESLSDENGFSVSLNASGDRVAIGAPYNDGVNGADSGSVRVFEYTPTPFSTSSDDVEWPWLATWTNDFAAAKVTPTYTKETNYPEVP